MARFRWTEEALAELRRLMNYDLPYEEIGARLGCTMNAARSKAYKMGWSGHGRSGRIRGDRQRGKPRSPETIAKMSATTKAQWQNPEFRARLEAGIRSAAAKARRNAKIAASYASRRGYVVPPAKRDEYLFIAKKLGSAREAARMLGLIPQPQATGGR